MRKKEMETMASNVPQQKTLKPPLSKKGWERRVSAQKQQASAISRQKNRVVLVTGAATGIGIALIKRLLARGDEVRVLLKEHPSTNERWKGIPKGVIPYVADIRIGNGEHSKVLREACSGADVIYHFASLGRKSKASIDDFIDINVVGTENLINAFIESNSGESAVHFIFISTTQVYGMRRPGVVLTEESETKPAGPYAETKLMAEQVIQAFADAHTNFRYTIFRTGTLYGNGYEGPYFKLFKAIRDQKMRYIGSGDSHLLLIHVDDAVKAMIMAADNPKSVNKVYNLTDGVPYTQRQLFEKAATFLGVPPPKRAINPAIVKLFASFSDMNPEEFDFLASDRVVSIAKLKAELNFKPDRTIDKDGKTMVDDFLGKFRK